MASYSDDNESWIEFRGDAILIGDQFGLTILEPERGVLLTDPRLVAESFVERLRERGESEAAERVEAHIAQRWPVADSASPIVI